MCIWKKIEAEKPITKAREKRSINTAVPQVKNPINVSTNISITVDMAKL